VFSKGLDDLDHRICIKIRFGDINFTEPFSMSKSLILTVGLLLSVWSSAQSIDPYQLKLRTGTRTPVANIDSVGWPKFLESSTSIQGKIFAFLQFESLLTESGIKELRATGIDLNGFIGAHAYQAVILGTPSWETLKRLGVRAAFTLSASEKLSPALFARSYPAWAVRSAGTLDVWVEFSSFLSYSQIQSLLSEAGFQIRNARFAKHQFIELNLEVEQVSKLAGLPFVQYVQAAPPPDQAINFRSRAGSRANLANASLAQGGRGLLGEGMVIGIGDNGDPSAHVDFSGRMISRYGSSIGQHGIHVSGTMAGAGIWVDTLAGYAPKARLIAQYFNQIFDFAPQYVRDEGMVVTNNSYGAIVNECGYNGLYDLYSRAWDQQAFDLPELLHVFAAGNSGTLTCPPYATGFKTVLGSYQSAKNVLTVGATQFTGDIASFSSRGPVIDGRIKPEITTQGAAVVSTGNGSYYTNNGTSMACPGASGGATLLIQRYRQLNAGTNPSNALVKNLLCNGATDKGNEGPDYTYGFGWMNLDRSLDILENNRYATGSLIHGGFGLKTFTVSSDQAQLKVMLNWNDPAAPMVVYRTLVNDLDLELVTPTGSILLPRILDTVAARVNQVAGVGVDRINNIEQITLYNPPTGNYTIRVRGTSVNTLTQAYFISWEVLAPSAKLTFPLGGESFRPGQSINIQWDTYPGAGTYNLEASTDNGSTWTPIVLGLTASTVQYSWITPNLPSDQVRVRLINTMTNAVSTSQSFLLIGLPVVSLASVQCETYISMDWTAVAGATDYEVMRLVGAKMQSVTIVPSTTTNFVFSGLSRDSVYWVGIRPRLNGKPGRRSISLSRQPNSGTCAGSISDNDFRMEALVSPASSGRLNTSVSLPANQTIGIRIKNLDDVSYTGLVTVSYQINAGAVISENITLTDLAAGASYTHNFSTTADLSAAGLYTIKLMVDGPSDLIEANNSLTRVIRQLSNAPLVLSPAWLDNFDQLPKQTWVQNQMGLDGSDRYDFSFVNSLGRLRSFINNGMSYSGDRALTLDVSYTLGGGNTNYLIGTYNLSNYSLSDEVRLDFRYKQHGQVSNANNRVWIRGNDAAPWIQAYDLFSNQEALGVYKSAHALELSDLLAANGQSFSSSFQIRWGQWGQYQAADNWSGAGYSLDDVKLYTVGDDIQLTRIDEPAVQSCVAGSSTSVKVTVRNSVGSTRTNIPVRMQLNGGAVVTESIASLAGNTSVQYTFTQSLSLSSTGSNVLKVWVDLPTDSYRENDTLIQAIRVLPVVSNFPYLQDFESGASDWFPGGVNASWDLGAPNSYRINGTGSGARSWKTRLAGSYNDNEFSYLYSPCFNVSGLTTPMLSFTVALDLEDCGTGGLCDGAYMEYTTDGITWLRLGAFGQGVNWYNRNYAGGNPVWSTQSYTRWHVATIPLPTGLNAMRLRFVMRSDGSVNRDGVAVDDIHIYENGLPIYTGPTLTTPISVSVAASPSWQPVVASNQLVAALQATAPSAGNVDVQAFLHSGSDRNTNGQYYLDRNWVLKGNNQLADTARVRLYFLDRETDSLVFATGCASCVKVGSVAELGLTSYRDTLSTSQNLSLADNGMGSWNYRSRNQVRRVPYQNGYYLEFPTKAWEEYWVNSGWRTGLNGLPVEIRSFNVDRIGSTGAQLQWSTAYEYDVVAHEIQVAKGNAAWQQQQFETIATVTSGGNSAGQQFYTYSDNSASKWDVWFYRVKIVHRDGWYVYSTAIPIVYDAQPIVKFYPNPSNGLFKGVFQANAGEVLRLKIFDAAGRLIQQQTQTATGFLDGCLLDLSGSVIASGVYAIQVELRGVRSVVRVVKQSN
jgi:hypothetical protein